MPVLTPISSTSLTSQELFLANQLLSMIGMFQQLKVFDELGVPDNDLKTIRFAYQNWRGDLNIQVRKRTTSIVPVVGLVLGVDYTLDLANGLVLLTTPINPGDEVRATYNFQYFSDQDFQTFLELSLIQTNVRRPTTAFTLESAPLDFNPVIILGAYVKCLERLLLDNGIWSRHLIWAEPEKWLVYLQSLKKESDEMWKFWLKETKRRGYIKIFGSSSGKFFTQMQVNEVNFRSFAILGQSG